MKNSNPKTRDHYLYPKEGKHRHLLKNWRPISLLYTAYKIASASIASRLKLMSPKIIRSDQKGFMKGRYIGENIRLLYDVLLYMETEKNIRTPAYGGF